MTDGRPLNDLGFGGLIDRHRAVSSTTRELHLRGHKQGAMAVLPVETDVHAEAWKPGERSGWCAATDGLLGSF